MYMLVDQRNENEIIVESNSLEPICRYLGYPTNLDEFDVKERLNKENDGLAGYDLVEVDE